MSGATMLTRFIRTTVCLAALAAAPLVAQTAPAATPITAADLRGDIATLASDAYEGRLPGTDGQTKTLSYIADQLAGLGFVGAADAQGGWFQPVPLVDLRYGSSSATFTDARGRSIGNIDVIARAPAGGAEALTALPMVFVGHGVDAQGKVVADVAGKIVLLLAADRKGESAMPVGERRAALVAAGAVATLTIGSERQRFTSLTRAYTGTRMQRPEQVNPAKIEGLIDHRSARRLLRRAGQDIAALTTASAAEDYRGEALPLQATLAATTQRHDLTSYNVVGRLTGARRDGKSVLMLGHWDHLGICRPEGAPDRVCNGAVDNASGIAVMLSIARQLATGARPDRDVILLATTAEEQGLQGAYQFAATPPLPLADILVALNVDTVAIAPAGDPFAIIGRGRHPYIDRQLETLIGDRIDNDHEADAFVRRQDGYALAKNGVPAYMIGSSFSNIPRLEAFLSGAYHGPEDELTETTELGGAADDANLHLRAIRHFASRTNSPLATPPVVLDLPKAQ